MLHIGIIAKREIKLAFRNAWTYSFLILFTLFTIAMMLLQSGMTATDGYTDTTATMMNMTFYLLPLIALLLGGFSATAEKESGEWGLLATYPLNSYTFVIGKWLGLAVMLTTIICFSFGFSGMILLLFGKAFSLSTYLFFLTFSWVLALSYLSIALCIGTFAKNRWHALIGSMTIWFGTIIIWPFLVIGVLGHLPSYTLVQPALQVFTLFNPAEFIRIFSIIHLGAGAAFGPTYYALVNFTTSTYGLYAFLGLFIGWNACCLGISGYFWKRGVVNE